MLPRLIVVLLAMLLFTGVAFAVTIGFALLIGALGDRLVAEVLRWVGGGLGIAAMVELVSLVVVLAWERVTRSE